MAYIPESNSVVAFQSDPTKLVGTVSVVGALSPSSVQVLNPVSTLAVNPTPASVQVLNPVSTLAVNQNGDWRVSVISSTPSSLLAGVSVIGLTPVKLGTSTDASVITVGSPVANQSISGTVNINPASVQVLNPVSILATTQSGTRITSLVSTIPSSVIVGASIFGQLPAGTAPLGSVATLQGTNPWVVVGSVYGSGSTVAFQGGTRITSLVSTVPSSVIVGASIFGLPPVNITNASASIAVNIIAGSVALGAVTVGSVNQADIPWVVGGSVLSFQGTLPWVIQSVVGTYAEDAAHTTGDKGLLVLGVRNDTLASITSADLDYSPMAQGPAGETVVAPAPYTKWVQGTVSVLNQFGVSMAAIAAQGSSIFTYITGVQIANMGPGSVLVTLSGATSSVIGYTIAPPGGGSNIVYKPAIKTNANGAFTASVSGVCSVYLATQGFISKT